MTGEKDTLARYKASLAGTETVSGHSCHILELVATTRTVAYPRMKLWIDTESFIVRKAEYSTQTGRLLKQMEVIETRSIGSRTIPVRTSISDALKKDSRTIMITQEIQIDIPLDSGLFSLENLTW